MIPYACKPQCPIKMTKFRTSRIHPSRRPGIDCKSKDSLRYNHISSAIKIQPNLQYMSPKCVFCLQYYK